MNEPWDPSLWSYTVEEVRNGLHEVTSDDHQGTDLRRTAWCFTDDEVEALLQGVKDEAAELTRRRRDAGRAAG